MSSTRLLRGAAGELSGAEDGGAGTHFAVQYLDFMSSLLIS